MTRYRVTYHTGLTLTVTLDADDEDTAADESWTLANEYANTVLGDHRQVLAEADLDGVGAETVEKMV